MTEEFRIIFRIIFHNKKLLGIILVLLCFLEINNNLKIITTFKKKVIQVGGEIINQIFKIKIEEFHLLMTKLQIKDLDFFRTQEEITLAKIRIILFKILKEKDF